MFLALRSIVEMLRVVCVRSRGMLGCLVGDFSQSMLDRIVLALLVMDHCSKLELFVE